MYFGLRQKLQVSVEVELAILKSLFERVDELAAKEFTWRSFWLHVCKTLKKPISAPGVWDREQLRGGAALVRNKRS